MTELPIDEVTREVWKKYPLRISGMKKSSCHGRLTVLVQSMEGGFVTRNCPECGRAESLPEADFLNLGLWVACPLCKRAMEPGRVPRSNYGYECQACDCYIKLAALLPRFSDL